MRRILYALCFILLCGLSARAQQAQLTGLIADPTGAVVPQASVSLRNQDTGVKYRTESNGAGVYTFPFVKPGPYEATVEKTGFKTVSRTGIKLDVSQIARLDFTLEVGTTQQSVTVSATAEVLNVTPSIGATIGDTEVVSLPLNGRDYTQLVTLSPGAVPNPYSRATNGFSLNGGQSLQTTLLLDGMDNTNYMLGLDSANMNMMEPSVDAIQEFKIDTANFSAEYGRSADGIIRVVLKSGTNAFHGDVFEFLRNTDLNANDFFANRSHLIRPPFHRNQFGGTLGGPIIKDRTFFFVSYQGTRQSSSQTSVLTVPTAQMVLGNFSGLAPIYDPQNVVNGVRQQFPGNIITPSSRLDTVGAKIAQLYPAPNLAGTVNNFGATQRFLIDGDQLDTRFDQQFKEHDSAFFRYSRFTGESDTGPLCPPPGDCGGTAPNHTPQSAWMTSVGETHIFSSALVNEFHLGYSRNGQDRLPPVTQSLFSQFGIPGIPNSANIVGLPLFEPSGFSNLGDGRYEPSEKLAQVAQLTDTLSWNRGRHDIRLGGAVHYTTAFELSDISSRGTIYFNGQFTSQVPGVGHGSSIADLLLGQTDNLNLTTVQRAHVRNEYFGGFINDSWKVTRRLTLNLGLRYDLQTPWWERDNLNNNFDYNPASPTYGTLVAATNGSIRNRSGANLGAKDFAPRVGLAYNLTAGTVVRAGYGIFYGDWGYAANAVAAVNPPFLLNVSLASPTTAAVSNYVLENGPPAGIISPTNMKNPTIYTISVNYPMPMVNQWNLSVQHQFSSNMSATISYVGSSAEHLVAENDINNPLPGPGALNPRRPFPTFGYIYYETPLGQSNYEGLQASLEKRYSKGIVATVAYTYSHSIDDVNNFEDFYGGGSPQNPLDTAAERASSGFDHRQRFVTSVVYNLPVGRKDGFLGGSSVSRQIFGGWKTGGIFVAQSGFPITLSVSPNPSNTETPARPNSTCNGNLPSGQRTVTRWFNTTCFAPAAAFTYGDSGRSQILAPGLVNLDFMVVRNFHFSESKYVEFRGEFFNLSNSAHFSSPNGTVGNGNIGSITSTAASSPNRQIELALKVWF